MTLKELRKSKKLTQEQAAKIVGMSRRGYQKLEKVNRVASRSFKSVYNELEEYGCITEDKGILTIDQIKQIIKPIFDNTDIQFAYLFGSYARNTPKENSDVDLYVMTHITGIHYFGLVEDLRVNLHKVVDLINGETITGCEDLLKEILKDGIRVYTKE